MSFYESVFVNVGIMIIIAQGVYVITGLTGLFPRPIILRSCGCIYSWILGHPV